MALEQRSKPAAYTDFISAFPLGINSGLEPILLEKEQLAFAVNATVRGGYASDRPPIVLREFDYQGNTGVQAAVEGGLFQGAGYYRPDFGTASLIAQISGRLFKFTETGVGSPWTVTEITIPGDPNSATATQCWMWQSEKWLIIQDGTGALPIFYDGVISRRSYGPSVVLGHATSSVPATPPGVGGLVTLTMDPLNPYTGPFNVPVLFNKEFYQPIANPTATYDVILTNITATGGNTEISGSQIIVKPADIGFIVTNNSPVTGFDTGQGSPLRIITATLTSVQGMVVGSVVNIAGSLWSDGGSGTFTVLSIDQLTNTVVFRDNHLFNPNPLIIIPGHPNPAPYGTVTIFNGSLVTLASNIAPSVLIGITTANFTNPTTGGTVSVTLDRPYSGPSGQLVWIGTESYTIAGVPPPVPGATLTLINLSDTSAIAYDFATLGYLEILSVPELPAGRMGCYGMGQTWQCGLDGRTFIFSDPVGGASGTPANDYRDAVLKTTELTFRGGSLRLPTAGDTINAMIFTATLDASLGQGALQVGTDKGIFSVQAPFDPTSSATATTPILTQSLIGRGPLAQNSTVQANNDTLFRSIEGVASLILARREFNTWGNVPISREMTRIIENDSRDLLPYGSAAVFDNRLIMTCTPTISARGIYHQGLIALNFDALSNLRTKAPACYDGLWTGINTLQVVSGFVNGSVRGFSFILDTITNKIQLYELRPTIQAFGRKVDPNNVFDFNGNLTRIQWSVESPIIFNKQVHDLTELLKLRDGEVYLRDLVPGALLTVQVEYRPDFYPCWVPWNTFTLCAEQVDNNSQPGYRMRIGLGEPSSTPCEQGNNRPLRTGYFFQVRLTFTGHCEFMGLRANAVAEPQPTFAKPECDVICDTDLNQLLVTT